VRLGGAGWALGLPSSGGPLGPAHNAQMPTPEPDRLDAPEGEEESPRRVAGTVRLMTEDPFEIDDEEAGLGQRFAGLTTAKPWLIPVALVGIGVAFLVLRRRR
jgi:hypothetical protein